MSARSRFPRWRRRFGWILVLLLLVVGSITLWRWRQAEESPQIQRLLAWFYDPTAHPEWALTAGERCGDAPMLLPTNGYVGFGWDDSFRPGHRHSGLDIFGPDKENGVTPIVAAYDGYLTREVGWKSTVILRHPDFPAVPAAGIAAGEQIWTYYTHMASRDGTVSYIAPAFAPGTVEQFVPAGTLLGYQGNWGGSPFQFTGRHLHFSVVKSDAMGSYHDEREITNTYNPIFLLGLTVTENNGIYCSSPRAITSTSAKPATVSVSKVPETSSIITRTACARISSKPTSVPLTASCPT